MVLWPFHWQFVFRLSLTTRKFMRNSNSRGLHEISLATQRLSSSRGEPPTSTPHLHNLIIEMSSACSRFRLLSLRVVMAQEVYDDCIKAVARRVLNRVPQMSIVNFGEAIKKKKAAPKKKLSADFFRAIFRIRRGTERMALENRDHRRRAGVCENPRKKPFR